MLEDMFLQYMAKDDALIQSQASSTRNLGQLASVLNNRPQGNLSSDAENNPRREGMEHCKAITLRNAKEIEGNPKKVESEKKKEEEKVNHEKNEVETQMEQPQ